MIFNDLFVQKQNANLVTRNYLLVSIYMK